MYIRDLKLKGEKPTAEAVLQKCVETDPYAQCARDIKGEEAMKAIAAMARKAILANPKIKA